MCVCECVCIRVVCVCAYTSCMCVCVCVCKHTHMHISPGHTTPASSEWEQSWEATPWCWHSAKLDSYPVHTTLSRNMGPSPRPNVAECRANAPENQIKFWHLSKNLILLTWAYLLKEVQFVYRPQMHPHRPKSHHILSPIVLHNRSPPYRTFHLQTPLHLPAWHLCHCIQQSTLSTKSQDNSGTDSTLFGGHQECSQPDYCPFNLPTCDLLCRAWGLINLEFNSVSYLKCVVYCILYPM